MSVPRALLDSNTPCYECCELEYYYEDDDKACSICGQMFDWDDLLQAYNEEDYVPVRTDSADPDDDIADVLAQWGQQNLWQGEEYEDFFPTAPRRAKAPTSGYSRPISARHSYRQNLYMVDIPEL